MIFIERITLTPIKDIAEIYPYKVFKYMELTKMNLASITMFYGSNGSGKSTLLNIIGEMIGAQRKKPLFRDTVYGDYGELFYPFDKFVNGCGYELVVDSKGHKIRMPLVRRLITSDDIFKDINARIDYNNDRVTEIQDASEEYSELLDERNYQFPGLHDLEHLSKWNKVRRSSRRTWADEHARSKKEMQSNGETSLSYFSDMIEPDGIYLLDEPENCLSPMFQIELMKLIDKASRQMNCQFLIATHSPLILSMPNALIYNLDTEPVVNQRWEELENVKLYWEFFKKNSSRFN